jgi:hypothetical protein
MYYSIKLVFIAMKLVQAYTSVLSYRKTTHILVKRENLLQDTVSFQRLPKHTAQLCVCQVPLQFFGMFARTHRIA